MENGGLSSPVTVLKNVGPKRAALYEKLGILTVGDLLSHYPRSYVDYTSPQPAASAPVGETAVIRGTVVKKLSPAVIRKGLTLYKLVADDGFTPFMVTIFNNEYAYYGIKAGEEYLFCGKVSRVGNRAGLALASFVPAGEEALRPVYGLTEGLSNGMVANNVAEALERFSDGAADPLPRKILQENALCQLRFALENIHFPKTAGERDIARKRLVFEEFFRISLALVRLKGRERAETGPCLADTDLSPFFKALPFSLTGAQSRAVGEILSDMKGPVPMNRLLQGDVGSGKTMVAAAGCFAAFKNGFQSAVMAPTEILAAQHYETLSKVLAPLGVKTVLLTGSLPQRQKDRIREEIAAGACDLIVGTHALVQQSVSFSRLGLVVTDEQHRFGVLQRKALAGKGESPHCLVMSATPIPRTLALIVYGDLEISVLDELPKGRQPIDTLVIGGSKRERALSFVRKRLEEGEQAYIVCPLIEEGESELLAACAYKEKIEREFFEGFPVGLLHGRMKPAEKDGVMADFKAGRVKLLVSTTVVEVGVDVPNATVMMIENAERFGLAQLHQLRGRVGRGEKKSYCILVSDNPSEENKKRLSVMKSTSDGFIIAREDLKLRGAGDFFGSRQHGMPALMIADFFEDADLFKAAQDAARKLLKEDPALKKPENRALGAIIDQIFDQNKDGWN